MTKRATCSLLAAVAMGVSLVSAPVAAAGPTCLDAGGHVRCETSGSVSIRAVPETRAPHVGEINAPRAQNRRRGLVLSW